jgi:hypothetical protein
MVPRDLINPGITYDPLYEQYESCVAAGLDLFKWDSGFYSRPFMARVVAWNRLKGKIANHVEDAKAAKIKATSKKR